MAQKGRLIIIEFLAQTNAIVTTGTFIFVLYARTLRAASFAAGTVACSISAKVLKRFVRQPRPIGNQKQTYGMPSTHSAAISFQAFSLLLSAFYPSIIYATPPSPFHATLVPAVFVPYAGAIAWSRIFLGHHTLPQVLAGVAWGAVSAVVWWAVWEGFVKEWIGKPVVRLLNGWVRL